MKGVVDMPKRGENIYKRKDGRWEGRYICGRDLNGKVKYGYVYAGNYREVKAKLFIISSTLHIRKNGLSMMVDVLIVIGLVFAIV